MIYKAMQDLNPTYLYFHLISFSPLLTTPPTTLVFHVLKHIKLVPFVVLCMSLPLSRLLFHWIVNRLIHS